MFIYHHYCSLFLTLEAFQTTVLNPQFKKFPNPIIPLIILTYLFSVSSCYLTNRLNTLNLTVVFIYSISLHSYCG